MSQARPRAFIVDDSALVRQVLSLCLRDNGVDVIGSAADPIFAEQRMARDWPDVIVLDIEMPRMDGLTFLKKLMAERPTPVVICSTLTEKGARVTMEALAAGAVNIFTKASVGVRENLEAMGRELARAVKEASLARPRPSAGPARPPPRSRAPEVSAGVDYRTTDKVIAIGTSTGGTQALERVLGELPPGCPGVVVVQHMPERFTAAFAERLNGVCRIDVAEAGDGDRVRPGLALIAPGGRHMQLVRSGAQYRVKVFDGPPVNRHKPSVDVLFRSVAQTAANNALGIIMTGMGDDGARGLLAMHQAGAQTLAQDEATSVVYGMPREAVRLGAAREVCGLGAIAGCIVRFA